MENQKTNTNEPNWIKNKEILIKEVNFSEPSMDFITLEPGQTAQVVFDVKPPKQSFYHWMGDKYQKCKGQKLCLMDHAKREPERRWFYTVAEYIPDAKNFQKKLLVLASTPGFTLNKALDYHGKMGIIYTLKAGMRKVQKSEKRFIGLDTDDDIKEHFKKDPYVMLFDKVSKEDRELIYLGIKRRLASDTEFSVLDYLFNYTATEPEDDVIEFE